jgi:hypothetical protein
MSQRERTASSSNLRYFPKMSSTPAAPDRIPITTFQMDTVLKALGLKSGSSSTVGQEEGATGRVSPWLLATPCSST